MKKIGLFGGSFDPIHFGHLNLAIEMLETHGLDEIVFCPAFCSPFKTEAPPVASASDRLEMVKLVVGEVPQFRVSSLEVDRGGPSFTIETLRALPKGDYYLILTEESVTSFSKWKEFEEIKARATLLIGKRKFPISSTLIRERFKKKLYCGHLVPAKALYYIDKHRLYSSSTYEKN
jgi:nicotinate-nucleotide adenylyltransferase